jgi:hypothetical protein
MDRTRVDDMYRTPRPGPGYSEDDRVGVMRDLKLVVADERVALRDGLPDRARC